MFLPETGQGFDADQKKRVLLAVLTIGPVSAIIDPVCFRLYINEGYLANPLVSGPFAIKPMKKYYLYIGARQYGPFSLAELKSQHLHRDTPVWREGLNGWVKAGQVEELQAILPATFIPPHLIDQEDQQTAPLPAARRSHLKTRFFNKLFFVVCLLICMLLIVFVLLLNR